MNRPLLTFNWAARDALLEEGRAQIQQGEKPMKRIRKAYWAIAFFTLAWWAGAQAQVAPATVLTVETENVVQYIEDPITVDLSKVGGTVPGATTSSIFYWAKWVLVGDIVAVNGQPVKGTMLWNARAAVIRPNAVGPGPNTPGIGDITRNALIEAYFEILGADGSQIGTIVALGMNAGSAAPGAPLAATAANFAIVGGSGPFLGVRGYFGTATIQGVANQRAASMTEDAANRRTNGGGKFRSVMHLIPMSRPEIVTTVNGPAVAHSRDFTLVTNSRPAAPGEILSVFVTGLGPTRPGVDPGQPFPASPLAAATSPVEVFVNGKAAEVLAAVGFPGAVEGYQVNFRLPPDTRPGTATIQVSAAWVAGPEVRTQVQ